MRRWENDAFSTVLLTEKQEIAVPFHDLSIQFFCEKKKKKSTEIQKVISMIIFHAIKYALFI